jgi:hypothetical protein
MNAMLGIGPTISMGRRALMGNGYFHPHLGYDFFYGIINRRASDAPVSGSVADPTIAIDPARNVIPHGPRFRVDLGFTVGQDNRGYIHGVGVSVGYQGLVHSFRGDLPFVHMLTLGLSYWVG